MKKGMRKAPGLTVAVILIIFLFMALLNGFGRDAVRETVENGRAMAAYGLQETLGNGD